MAHVWVHGSTILMANRRPPPQSNLEVLVSRWDFSNDCFMLEGRIPVPVTGDAELMTTGWVLDSESGLFQSYLVLEERSSLLIGCLDLDDKSFEVVAELSLPPANGTPDNLSTAIKDWWLVNGPSVLCMWEGQLLVATSKDPETVAENPISGETTVDYQWEAHLLQVCDSGQQHLVNLHFCGEIRMDTGPEAVLSVTQKSIQSGTSSGSTRCPLNWSYLSLAKSSIEPSIFHKIGQIKEEMNGPFKLALSTHVPADVDPNKVSCIQVLPVAPCSTAIPNDFLIGTTDRRLMKCRSGHVIETVHLEGIPSQLLFAVVAGGQGVIVVVLDDAQQSALALCAESLQKLQGLLTKRACSTGHHALTKADLHPTPDWSRIWQVVVGDFTLSGHDQIVLLQGTADSMANWELCTSLAQNGMDSTSIHGFSKFDCPGTPQGSQQHLKEVKAINNHRVSGLEAISKALHERIDTGLAQLKEAEQERESRMELYHVSSCVMQGIVAKHALENKASLRGNTSEPGKRHEEHQLQVIQATRVQNRICGTNWFLVVEAKILEAWSSTSLHNVSLLVTSLNGSIGGRSSVLESLYFTEGSKCLTMTIPLQNLSLLPGFPFHVILKAEHVSIGKEPPTGEGFDVVDQRWQHTYTQWLCCSEVIHPTSVQPLQPKEAATLFARATEERHFVVAAKSEECILQLAETMRSELVLDYVLDQNSERSERNFNLMSMTGLGVVFGTVCCIGTHALITLKSSNAQLMEMTNQSFILLLRQHQFQLLPCTQHETLEKSCMLADALLEELRVLDSLKQSKYARRLDSKESAHEDKSACSQLRRLQMFTDRRCAEVLSLLK